MPQFDLPLADLQKYSPDRSEPRDFDEFWSSTIAESIALATDPVVTMVDAGYTQLVTEDVTFSGFGGHPIKGWMVRPRHVEGPLPTVITYQGYGGGRGLVGEWTALASAGFAQFVMDSRGQGSGHRTGDTDDLGASGPHLGGFMTMGIQSPTDYYYRRLFTDAVLAVRAVQAHPSVDTSRVVLSGGSQGGAICLASAALSPSVVEESPIAAIVDVPFMAHMRRATQLVDTLPYSELVRYMRTRRHSEEEVFGTLDYFDGVNFAARATMQSMFSVGLLDDVCPPSTVYAAYNHYAGPKRMNVYGYNGHEQGGPFQEVEHLRFLREVTG